MINELTDETYLFLNNNLSTEFNQGIKNCEFEVDFKKVIKFSEPSECAIVDLNLPIDLRVNKFEQPQKMSYHLLWNEKHLKYLKNRLKESDDPKFYDKPMNQSNTESFTKQYTISEDVNKLAIRSTAQLIEVFKQMNDSIEKEAIIFTNQDIQIPYWSKMSIYFYHQ